MKARVCFTTGIFLSIALALIALVSAGCKSTPKIDWNSRVGNYTYDQAVAELGPPDKTATLSDGKLVADWIRRNRSGGFSFGVGTGMSTGSGAVGVGTSTGTAPSDNVLRLTFGADKKLISWYKGKAY